ncbi:glycosyltransferase [Neobacillus sp. SM06]|uniref:glycosyltransferase n=1 Tax=Neobacillus sp. SM06 TaxID=3422492 RepID=UPI003D26FD5A
MNPSVCFMIPTTAGREPVLYWIVEHLCKDIPSPFHLYIYNDHAKPLIKSLFAILNKHQRRDIELVVYNDTGLLNSKKSGAAGARRLMFEQVKRKFDVVVSLDDDMQLMPNWLETILEAMEQYPNHNVFTGIVRGRDGKIQFAGSKFTIKDQTLYRQELTEIKGKYDVTDWGPIGCMALCRSALSESISIPPIYIRDDASLFLELRRFGWNETVVVTKAEAIHKPIPVPSSNLRLKEELEKEANFFRNQYGLEFGY